MRVLHVLHSSLPNLSGYSIRSNYIMRCQEEMGMECMVVTSAQQATASGANEVIEGRKYLRTSKQPERRTGARELGLMHALKKSVHQAIKEFRPDIVHAASPVLVGLPALYMARRHKLPFVYEVRDLWENASVDRGKWAYDSIPYKGAKALESIVYKQADAVVAICKALRDEIAPRVGSKTDLWIVPNGVESEQFSPKVKVTSVLEKYALQDKKLLGYIGAFQPYEGLEVLIDAMPEIVRQIPNAHLMITGGGNDLETRLRKRVTDAGLDSTITFTGRVPHSEVADMYSVVDLMVYPRISTRTTELTTPLKPLEAMALEIPVMLSSTKAMMELVRPGETGYAFEAGSSKALAQAAVKALQDEKRGEVIASARSYVETERHWPKLASLYQEIYERALARRR